MTFTFSETRTLRNEVPWHNAEIASDERKTLQKGKKNDDHDNYNVVSFYAHLVSVRPGLLPKAHYRWNCDTNHNDVSFTFR